VFGKRVPELLQDYEVPKHFPEDLLSVLEDERPFYRWIVIGAPRSGSSFHLDPFRTAAWNALLVGKKRWTLYPPGITPPGVDVDHDDDGSPDYSGADPVVWFLEHYPKARRKGVHSPKHPLEVIQEPGELVYVPTNWWHMVWNLEESIAVTQNFCDSHNFKIVYEDMKTDKSFVEEHVLLTKKMLKLRPDLMQQVEVPPAYYQKNLLSDDTCEEEKKDSHKGESVDPVGDLLPLPDVKG